MLKEITSELVLYLAHNYNVLYMCFKKVLPREESVSIYEEDDDKSYRITQLYYLIIFFDNINLSNFFCNYLVMMYHNTMHHRICNKNNFLVKYRDSNKKIYINIKMLDLIRLNRKEKINTEINSLRNPLLSVSVHYPNTIEKIDNFFKDHMDDDLIYDVLLFNNINIEKINKISFKFIRKEKDIMNDKEFKKKIVSDIWTI